MHDGRTTWDMQWRLPFIISKLQVWIILLLIKPSLCIHKLCDWNLSTFVLWYKPWHVSLMSLIKFLVMLLRMLCLRKSMSFEALCHAKFREISWNLKETVTFGKSSTSLVQQLKKKFVHKNCATGYWLPLSLFKFFLKFLDQQCWRFSEGYLNNFSTKLSSQIFDCCPRNFLIHEERIGNVVSTSHWITPVLLMALAIKSHLAKPNRFKNSFAKKISVLKRPNVHSSTKVKTLVQNVYVTRKLLFQPVTSDNQERVSNAWNSWQNLWYSDRSYI